MAWEQGDAAFLQHSDVCMTVYEVKANGAICCVWFNINNDLKMETFPAACLEHEEDYEHTEDNNTDGEAGAIPPLSEKAAKFT